MKSLILAVLFASVFCAGLANAQDATTNAAPSYTDVIRTCGAEWRGRSDKATNTGRDAWNKFRAECVTRKGFVSKRNRASFTMVPDAPKAN